MLKKMERIYLINHIAFITKTSEKPDNAQRIEHSELDILFTTCRGCIILYQEDLWGNDLFIVVLDKKRQFNMCVFVCVCVCVCVCALLSTRDLLLCTTSFSVELSFQIL